MYPLFLVLVTLCLLDNAFDRLLTFFFFFIHWTFSARGHPQGLLRRQRARIPLDPPPRPDGL